MKEGAKRYQRKVPCHPGSKSIQPGTLATVGRLQIALASQSRTLLHAGPSKPVIQLRFANFEDHVDDINTITA